MDHIQVAIKKTENVKVIQNQLKISPGTEKSAMIWRSLKQ
jgi:hypothetical protein